MSASISCKHITVRSAKPVRLCRAKVAKAIEEKQKEEKSIGEEVTALSGFHHHAPALKIYSRVVHALMDAYTIIVGADMLRKCSGQAMGVKTLERQR